MTRLNEIEARDPLPPGPKLDAIVATGVMGWKKVPYYKYGDPSGSVDWYEWQDEDGRTHARVSLSEYSSGDYLFEWFDPSTDPAAAELVKAELVERGWIVELTIGPTSVTAWVRTAGSLDGERAAIVVAKTEAHAVALLAQAVMEWEEGQR